MKKKSEKNNIFLEILKYKRIGIIIHTDPDADAIGSGLALKKILEDREKTVELSCLDGIPQECRFEKWYEINSAFPQKCDIIVALDIGGIEKSGYSSELKKFTGKTFLIDHHNQDKIFTDFSHVRNDKSSTCEILYDIFMKNNIQIESGVATLLLAGILYDTQYLQHECSTPELMEKTAQLLRCGARPSKLSRQMKAKQTIDKLKILGKAFQNVQFDQDSQVVTTAIVDEDAEEIGGINSYLNSISVSSVSLCLTQKQGMVKGSLRCDTFKKRVVDVSKIARKFGGGGHKFAAGFVVPGKVVKKDWGWDIEK